MSRAASEVILPNSASAPTIAIDVGFGLRVFKTSKNAFGIACPEPAAEVGGDPPRAPVDVEHRPGHGVQLTQQRGPMPAQHTPDSRGLQVELARDEHPAAACEVTHDPHPRLHARRRPARMGTGDARTVHQPRGTVLAEPAPPSPGRGTRDPHLRRDMRDRTPRSDALDHDQPASRSQPGISVRHERPPCDRAEELDSSNSTPEVSPTSTTIRVSTASAGPHRAQATGTDAASAHRATERNEPVRAAGPAAGTGGRN